MKQDRGIELMQMLFVFRVVFVLLVAFAFLALEVKILEVPMSTALRVIAFIFVAFVGVGAVDRLLEKGRG